MVMLKRNVAWIPCSEKWYLVFYFLLQEEADDVDRVKDDWVLFVGNSELPE
jgi:hypothetical protein